MVGFGCDVRCEGRVESVLLRAGLAVGGVLCSRVVWYIIYVTETWTVKSGQDEESFASRNGMERGMRFAIDGLNISKLLHLLEPRVSRFVKV